MSFNYVLLDQFYTIQFMLSHLSKIPGSKLFSQLEEIRSLENLFQTWSHPIILVHYIQFLLGQLRTPVLLLSVDGGCVYMHPCICLLLDLHSFLCILLLGLCVSGDQQGLDLWILPPSSQPPVSEGSPTWDLSTKQYKYWKHRSRKRGGPRWGQCPPNK